MSRWKKSGKAFCRAVLVDLRKLCIPVVIAVLEIVVFFQFSTDSEEELESVAETGQGCLELTSPPAPEPDLLKEPFIARKIRRLVRAEAKVAGLGVHKSTLKWILQMQKREATVRTPMEIEMDLWREKQRREWVRERDCQRRGH